MTPQGTTDPMPPQGTTDIVRRADGSGQMFDQIARRYDLLNRIMSFGLDRNWRRALVRSMRPTEGGRLLDVATGTADVALALAKAYPSTTVTGLDPSVGMLDVGRKKVIARNNSDRVTLIEGDAQAMPFEDSHFDSACIAFGIRNVPDRTAGLREMVRVTRPGGTVVVLELGEPAGFMAPFARFHVHHVVPRLGALLSGNAEYDYLQWSIAAFPAVDVFAGMMRDAGLADVTIRRFAFGASNLYVGVVQ